MEDHSLRIAVLEKCKRLILISQASFGFYEANERKRQSSTMETWFLRDCSARMFVRSNFGFRSLRLGRKSGYLLGVPRTTDAWAEARNLIVAHSYL